MFILFIVFLIVMSFAYCKKDHCLKLKGDFSFISMIRENVEGQWWMQSSVPCFSAGFQVLKNHPTQSYEPANQPDAT